MLRYPSDKIENRGRKWTIKQLDAIPASWEGDTISDGEGLNGDVRVIAAGAVKIAFKYSFRWDGKIVRYYCGTYPDKSMESIRATKNKAKDSLKNKIDPRIARDAALIVEKEKTIEAINREARRQAEGLTVGDLFDDWINNGVHRKDGNKIIRSMFENHILPGLGKIEIRSLTYKQLIANHKKIAHDKPTTAFEVSKDFKQMMSWAEKRAPWRKLLAEGNPAALVEREHFLPKGFKKERTRVLDSSEIRNLMIAFETIEERYHRSPNRNFSAKPVLPEVQCAVWLCLSTLCRIGELMKSEWEHINFQKRTWFIPAKNVKGEDGKKTDHIVYLSDFSLKQFKKLQLLTGHSKWVFPATNNIEHICERSYSKQIGDRQVQFKNRTKKFQNRVCDNSLVIGDEEWTLHDLRRTGATIMQSFFDVSEGQLITELCLHHKILQGAARNYLLFQYQDAMTNAWHKLGEHIENLLT